MYKKLLLTSAISLMSLTAYAAGNRSDYDLDNDGLIEINDLTDLNAIPKNGAAIALYGSTKGCPSTQCVGYELTKDVNFDSNNDGLFDEADSLWNGGKGWEPASIERVTFEGNGFAIRNLNSHNAGIELASGATVGGLFNTVKDSTIRNLALTGPLTSVSGTVAGLLAVNVEYGTIAWVFASGRVEGTNVGGIIGYGFYTVTFSDVIASVLVHGSNIGSLAVSGSAVTVRNALIGGKGFPLSPMIDSVYFGPANGVDSNFNEIYWPDRSSVTGSRGAPGSMTLATLACPTKANNTSCLPGKTLFNGWNTTPNNQKSYWDMGSAQQVPGLVLKGKTYRDSDADGAADTDDHFPLNDAATVDADADGAADYWIEGCDTACGEASGLQLDHFPAQAAASADADYDGLPDAWNANCDTACQAASGLRLDAALQDQDNDGIADAKDSDDDNNGKPDADANNNGLIDIRTLAEFNAIRFDPLGQRLKLSQTKLPPGPDSSGCPKSPANTVGACHGYELVADLDFDTNSDGKLDAADTFWNAGKGWIAIENFNTLLEGNGHVLRNWMGQGVFGDMTNATVRRLGFAGTLTDIKGPALAYNAYSSQVEGVFVTGKVGAEGSINSFNGNVTPSGGLINSATNVRVSNVFSTARVRGRNSGAIVGAGEVQGAMLFTVNGDGYGLEGDHAYASQTKIVQSYWANSGKYRPTVAGSTFNTTLAYLQCPTQADNTSCQLQGTLYEGWATQKDASPNNPGGKAYWDFGTNTQLPGLVLNGTLYRDSDGDGYLDADDQFPTVYAAAFDRDRDGAPEAWTEHCDTECRKLSGLVLDQLSSNPAASVDKDFDGLPERWNASCDQACQTASGLSLDTRPNDTDNDGLSNELDADDNKDGKTDADADSNGLVEIHSLTELDAVRHSLDGGGRRLTAVGALDTSGCPARLIDGAQKPYCRGYELVADLDFDTNGDGK
ncbi:MAG: hypothetical protein RL497_1190, partial [Pseudomonadota bacterium]